MAHWMGDSSDQDDLVIDPFMEKNTTFKINDLEYQTHSKKPFEFIGGSSDVSNPLTVKENAGAAATASGVTRILKAGRFRIGRSMYDLTSSSEVAA